MKNIYFAFLFIFLTHAAINAQTVVLGAAKDNTIYSNLVTNSNGAGDNITSGAIQSSPVRRALLMFDLSAIPPGAVVTAASLRLVMNRTVSGVHTFSLHRLNENWGEGLSNAGAGGDGNGAAAQAGDATWTCSFADGAGGCTSTWSASGGAFQPAASAITAVNAGGPYTWSSAQLITDVQDWVSNGATNFGWILVGGEGNPGSAKRFSSRTNPVVGDRPTLTVSYNTIVPISLNYFKAQAQSSGTRLTWQTAQEINNDYFEIEFSTDGVSFTSAGKVKGGGNTSTPQSYQFTHYTNLSGKLFYRLAQSDLNGRRTYSPVEWVELKARAASLLVSPNPVGSQLLIPGFQIDGRQRYTIINLQGEKIVEGVLLKPAISLSAQTPPGMYLLRILHGDGWVQTGTFIKQ